MLPEAHKRRSGAFYDLRATVPLPFERQSLRLSRGFLQLLDIDRRHVAFAAVVTVQPNGEVIGIGDLKDDQLLAGDLADIDRCLRHGRSRLSYAPRWPARRKACHPLEDGPSSPRFPLAPAALGI